MSNTLLDLSGCTELEWVADLVRPIQAAAAGARHFIVGAMARELVLVHGFGVDPGRATRDLDFAVQVAGWDEYHRVREALIASAGFSAVEGIAHRLVSADRMVVDVLPFGAVEAPGRTVAWPPEGSEAMSALGFAEVAATTLAVALPGNVRVDVAGPAGQALLKLVAWSDRRSMRRGGDAYDLTILLRNYLESGHEERLYDEAAELLDEPDFDREVAGAILLGRDVASMLEAEGTSALRAILEPELAPNGKLRLVGDLRCDAEHALRLVRGLARGLAIPGAVTEKQGSTSHQRPRS